MCRKRIR